jgi:hypothetical protein
MLSETHKKLIKCGSSTCISPDNLTCFYGKSSLREYVNDQTKRTMASIAMLVSWKFMAFNAKSV